MVTEVIIAQNRFTRTPQADILNLDVEDLEFASKNLPDQGKEAVPGRVNKAAAFHFLAEIYLWQKIQKAVKLPLK